MSSLRKPGPVRLAAIVGLALLAGAGCDSKPAPDPVPAPPITTSPEVTATAEGAFGDAGDPGDGGQGSGGSGGSGSSGSSGGSASSGGSGSSTSQWPSPEDCVSYNPNNVTVQYENGLYLVKDGSTVVMRVQGYAGETVGDKALALAKRFRKHCYIGRDNGREDENSYVYDYWRDSSGMTPTIPEQEDDCSSYDRTDLTVDDMGSGHGWRVRENDHVLHVFDNEKDARNGKLVLAKYNQICSIGSDGDQDDPQIVNYML